jgi:hypothetical protein
VKFFPTHRELRRARFRFLVRVFSALAMVLAIFAAVVAVGYLFGR